jgi:hypothetical protein
LQPGDHFQIVFVTSGTRDAVSSNIADYNAFVAAEAAPITATLTGLGYTGISWTAIATTSTTNARDNAPQLSTVYDTRGHKVADSAPNHGLYSGLQMQLYNPPAYDQHGNFSLDTLDVYVWTGSGADGTNTPGNLPLGSGLTPRGGISVFADLRYLDDFSAAESDLFALYGLSGELTVPGEVVPEPSSILLLGIGVVGALGYWRLSHRTPRSEPPAPRHVGGDDLR